MCDGCIVLMVGVVSGCVSARGGRDEPFGSAAQKIVHKKTKASNGVAKITKRETEQTHTYVRRGRVPRHAAGQRR